MVEGQLYKLVIAVVSGMVLICSTVGGCVVSTMVGVCAVCVCGDMEWGCILAVQCLSIGSRQYLVLCGLSGGLGNSFQGIFGFCMQLTAAIIVVIIFVACSAC